MEYCTECLNRTVICFVTPWGFDLLHGCMDGQEFAEP